MLLWNSGLEQPVLSLSIVVIYLINALPFTKCFLINVILLLCIHFILFSVHGFWILQICLAYF